MYGDWVKSNNKTLIGKDPSNVLKAATFYARYVAKSLVHH